MNKMIEKHKCAICLFIYLFIYLPKQESSRRAVSSQFTRFAVGFLWVRYIEE